MLKTNAVPRQRRPRRTGAGRTPVRAACFVLLAALGSCATPPSDPEALAEFKALNDPLEPTNRALFAVNNAIDAAVVRPVAQAYEAVLPEAVRNGVHNVLSNLGAPVRLANDMLQGQPRRAGDTAMRFLINSTAGVLGIFDVASKWGYPRRRHRCRADPGLVGYP